MALSPPIRPSFRFAGTALVVAVAAGAVASQSAAQSITEFQIPTSNASPFEITTGPDGNIWFDLHKNP